jgi:hypothetical protein
MSDAGVREASAASGDAGLASELHEGGCICGLLRYAVRGNPTRITVCHCSWCQRRTGSAFGVGAVFPSDRHELRGPYRTYRHRSDESGRWLDLHFCPNCGANVGFTLEWVPGIFAVDAGTFDDPSWIKPDAHPFRYIYLSSAQAWSTPPQGAECHARHFRV